MKLIKLYSNLFSLLFLTISTLKLNAQCIDTLPANTIIITSDTTIGFGNKLSNYLICPGKKLTYSGTQSLSNTYYLEQSAKLVLNSYHYPNIYLKNKSELNAQHSLNNQSRIMAIKAEMGCVFTDTLDYFTSAIKWCSSLQYNYSKLPKSIGCATASNSKLPLIEEFVVYPNPLKSTLTIKNLKLLHANISLHNLQGQVVYQLNIENTDSEVTLNIESLNKGIYYLKISESSQKETGKTFFRTVSVE